MIAWHNEPFCPKCDSKDITFNTKENEYQCNNCGSLITETAINDAGGMSIGRTSFYEMYPEKKNKQ